MLKLHVYSLILLENKTNEMNGITLNVNIVKAIWNLNLKNMKSIKRENASPKARGLFSFGF